MSKDMHKQWCVLLINPLLPFLLRKHSIAYKSILNFSRCTRHLLCTLLRNVNPVRVTFNHPTEVISNIGEEIVIPMSQLDWAFNNVKPMDWYFVQE